MVKEIITLGVGGAGVKIADKIFNLLTDEHQIDSKGSIEGDSIYNHHTVFEEMANGKHVPRTLFLDTDSYDIDALRKGERRDLYRQKGMVNGKQDCSHNFVKGMYTLGKEVIDQAVNQVRWLLEQCDFVEGVVFSSSLSGGSGSGLGTLLIQRMAFDLLRKKTLFINAVLPSPKISNIIVQPYNATLALSELINSPTNNIVNCFDNEQLYSTCQRNGIQNPSYNQINECIARSVLLTTNHHRTRERTSNFSQILTNLVPYKKMSFITPHMVSTSRYSSSSPLATFEQLYGESSSLASHGLKQGVNLSACTLLRGSASMPVLNSCLAVIKQKLKTVDWCPNGVKLIMSNNSLQGSPLEGINLNNSSSFKELLCRVGQKRELMWERRAYCHWFVGEGMEDHQMRTGGYSLQTLQRDYEELARDTSEGSENDE